MARGASIAGRRGVERHPASGGLRRAGGAGHEDPVELHQLRGGHRCGELDDERLEGGRGGPGADDRRRPRKKGAPSPPEACAPDSTRCAASGRTPIERTPHTPLTQNPMPGYETIPTQSNEGTTLPTDCTALHAQPHWFYPIMRNRADTLSALASLLAR